MKNILVVFTGGTIGSSAADGTINTSGHTAFQLLELYKQQPSHQPINFSTLQPLQLLSENLAPQAWQTIIQAIERSQPEQYDGIIITHGTDTLAYTAAALSLYFHAIEIPILMVSSNYPLADTRANGLENFSCAVEFITQEMGAGVFVPYRNPGQSMQVHLASRLSCSLQLTGDFFSVQDKSHLQFVDGRFSLLNPAPEKPKTAWPLTADFSKQILMVKPYPGLDYRHFNLNQVDAVLHDLYHSGTACASKQWGGQFSLLDFIGQCKKQNLDIYLAPIIKSENAYQSTRALIDEGAAVIWNMSIEMAYVKLSLAYGNFTEEKQRMDFMATNIAGELV